MKLTLEILKNATHVYSTVNGYRVRLFKGEIETHLKNNVSFTVYRENGLRGGVNLIIILD